MVNLPLINYILSHQKTLIQIDFLKEIWMIPERMVAGHKQGSTFLIETNSPLYEGKLFVYENMFYSVLLFDRVDDRKGDIKTYRVEGEETGIVYDHSSVNPLCTPQDRFDLLPGVIVNYNTDTALNTTVGVFMANYVFFVYPFGDVIDYLNEEFTATKMEKRIAGPLLEGRISVDAVKNKYVSSLSLIAGSPDIVAGNITEKTITIPQSIHDLREKLVAENREALEAGDASVMTDIEKRLIKAYREYLQGDPSLHFLLKKKYFDVTLKKLFLTQGMTEIFGSPGKFKFVEQPMGNGWKQKDLSTIFNEVRSGSYSRAIETANGGVIAKLILRVLQDTRITIDDCGTTRGEYFYATEDNLKDFIWNYIVAPDGNTTLLTEETLSPHSGQDVTVRTPGYCQATQGFCSKCFGYLFEQLGQKAFGPIANDFAKSILVASLKKMHGSANSTADISELNRYVVGV